MLRRGLYQATTERPGSSPPPLAIAPTPRPVPVPTNPIPSGSYSRPSGDARCQGVSRTDIAPPRINVSAIRQTGTSHNARYTVFGSVEGACLMEAGAFENGIPRQLIVIRTLRDFGRYSFQVIVDGNKNPEIRVYNVTGDSAVYPLSYSKNTPSQPHTSGGGYP